MKHNIVGHHCLSWPQGKFSLTVTHKETYSTANITTRDKNISKLTTKPV